MATVKEKAAALNLCAVYSPANRPPGNAGFPGYIPKGGREGRGAKPSGFFLFFLWRRGSVMKRRKERKGNSTGRDGFFKANLPGGASGKEEFPCFAPALRGN